MTKGNGKPCKICGTKAWYTSGGCVQCTKERAQRYRSDNPEAKKRSSRLWRLANPEAAREHRRKWQQANPEKAKEGSRRYYHANSDAMKESNRKWYRNNPEASAAKYHRRQTLKTKAGGSYTAAEWKDLCHHFGNKCLCCGRDDVKLTADHVTPVSKGGSSNIDNIQPLCGICNSRKKDKTIDYRPGSGLGRWIQRKLFG